MKRVLSLFIFSIVISLPATAQDEALFGKTKEIEREGFLISLNGNFDMPGADMAKRFGASYRVGPAVQYKTKDNWIFGVKFDFIVGNNVKEDSLLINILKDGGALNSSGDRTTLNIYERGYAVGLQGGYIFNLSKKSKVSGIMLLTTVGFMQHKIKIFDRDKNIPALEGDYNKGYDRLTNGLLIEEFAGYNYYAKDGLLNFYVGLNLSAGFTKGRRDYLYDVMRPDTKSRMDLLLGARAGLNIAIFNRKSEEIYFK